MTLTANDLKTYSFDYGDAYKTITSPTLIILTKTKSEESFDNSSWFDPFDYESKEDCFNSICSDLDVNSADDIDFEISENDLEESLNHLFFEENDKPKDAIFDFAKLTPHAQEVVNCYASEFIIDDDITLLELLDKISEVYVGKHDSSSDYAEIEVDNQAFGIKVPSSLRQYIDFEVMGDDLEQGLIIVDYNYFRKT